MKPIIKIIALVLLVVLFLIFVFRHQIENGLACLLYYEQCTAEKIEGLTKEECLNRNDAVAFLLEGEICLVQ